MSSSDKLGNTLLPLTKPSDSTFLADLPVELLLVVLSFLDFQTLETAGSVCKRWREITNNNDLWKEIFYNRLHRVVFSSLTRSHNWRTEFTLRQEVLRKWSKSVRFHQNFPLDSQVITDLAVDFSARRVYSFSQNSGDVIACNLKSGRTEGCSYGVTPTGATCYDISRNAIVFGRMNGSVCYKWLSGKKADAGIVYTQNHVHPGYVSSICVTNSFVQSQSGFVSCVSGSSQGGVVGWDLWSNRMVFSYSVADCSICYVESNYKDTIVAVDESGTVHVLRGTLKEGTQREESSQGSHSWEISSFHGLSWTDSSRALIDFSGENLVLVSSLSAVCFSFHRESFGVSRTLPLQTDDPVCQAAIDGAGRFPVDCKVAGSDGCFAALVLKSGRVLLWNLRGASQKVSTVIDPVFKHGLVIPEHLPPVTSIAINGVVCLLGSYNGWCQAYNVLTGDLIRVTSTRISKKLLSLELLTPVREIKLDHLDGFATNGVYVVGNVMQYFQFGELDQYEKYKKHLKPKRAKVRGGVREKKFKYKRGIQLELDDLEFERSSKDKAQRVLSKYNGLEFDEDEEMKVALAMSESMSGCDGVSDDILRAIEESENVDRQSVDFEQHDYDAELAEALRRSLQ